MHANRWFMSLALALFLAAPFARAADYNFAEIPWGIEAGAVHEALAGKGFVVLDGATKDGDIRFTGELIGYKVVGIAGLSDDKLAKMLVTLVTPDNKARSVYRDLRETLVQKYGAPKSSFETFIRPYFNGDGYEDQAIRLGKARFASFWGSGQEGALYISITERLNIAISYESAQWGTEANRRKARARSVF